MFPIIVFTDYSFTKVIIKCVNREQNKVKNTSEFKLFRKCDNVVDIEMC